MRLVWSNRIMSVGNVKESPQSFWSRFFALQTQEQSISENRIQGIIYVDDIHFTVKRATTEIEKR